MDYFIVVNETELNNHLYRSLPGNTFSEPDLREWAEKAFKVKRNASLKKIAKAIKHGGWMLFKYIPPAE